MGNPTMSISIKTFKQLKHYQNQWIAISDLDGEITGSGATAVAARSKARDKGYIDVTLLKVFPFDMHYASTNAVQKMDGDQSGKVTDRSAT